MPSEEHYPDVDEGAPKKEQASQATTQAFNSTRGKLGVAFAHLGLVLAPYFAYRELTSPPASCTESEIICSFTPGSMGLPLVAIWFGFSLLAVGMYWMVIR